MLHKWMKMYRRMERNVSEPDSGKNRFADRMKAKFPFRRNSFSDAPQNKEEKEQGTVLNALQKGEIFAGLAAVVLIFAITAANILLPD